MTHPLIRLIRTWLLLALGVLVSATLVPGISYDSPSSLIIVVILLSFLNAFLKPLLLLFTLPFIVLTMGIGVLFINAFLFYIVGGIVDGFHVAGFGSAFLGGLIVSLVTLFVNSFLKGPPGGESSSRRPTDRRTQSDDDIIDI